MWLVCAYCTAMTVHAYSFRDWILPTALRFESPTHLEVDFFVAASPTGRMQPGIENEWGLRKLAVAALGDAGFDHQVPAEP